MCTSGNGVPSSAGEALAMMESALDFLNGEGAGDLAEPALGEALQAMSVIGAKQSAARNALLGRFDAVGAHDVDGYQGTAAWLAAKTQTARPTARGQVKRMRQAAGRPLLGAAMAAGTLSESWAMQVITWSKPLPPEFHEDLDRLLLAAVKQGALLEDLGLLIAKFIEEWKKTRPDPDDPPGDDGFEDRKVSLSHTFGGAGKLNGDLTAECAAAWQAIFDSLGKKKGREDARTPGQRRHDTLQEAAELLLRAKLVPDRAGADTRVDAVMSLAWLRDADGAAAVEDAWLAAGAEAGHHIFVSGPAAEAVSCDALITPVVTGGADCFGPAHQPHAGPWNSRSVPIDVGWSTSIPEAIRRAVMLRDRKCRWPGCDKRPSACDVHHIRHKKDGGPTSVQECVILCQFHHDICVHRWGWQIELLPNGELNAYGPYGQVLQGHPPSGTGPPGLVRPA